MTVPENTGGAAESVEAFDQAKLWEANREKLPLTDWSNAARKIFWRVRSVPKDEGRSVSATFTYDKDGVITISRYRNKLDDKTVTSIELLNPPTEAGLATHIAYIWTNTGEAQKGYRTFAPELLEEDQRTPDYNLQKMLPVDNALVSPILDTLVQAKVDRKLLFNQ